MWIITAKCLKMIGGTSMSVVCGRNRSTTQNALGQELSVKLHLRYGRTDGQTPGIEFGAF